MNFAPGLEALLAAVDREEEREREESFEFTSTEADSVIGTTTVWQDFIAEELPTTEDTTNGPKKNRNLTNSERLKVLLLLIPYELQSRPGKLQTGATCRAAKFFKIHPITCRRIWNRYKETVSAECPAGNMSNRRSNCGRKLRSARDLEVIKSVPHHRRGDLRSLAEASGIPKTSLWRLLGRDVLRRHTGTTKPILTEANKLQRIEWALSHLDENGRFHEMYNVIHVDEKWFYIRRLTVGTYILTDEDPPPDPKCKSKRYRLKVMFLCAVARPRYDTARGQWFDGKIGCWPYVYKEAAQRRSRNRARGTLVTKTKNVDRAEYQRMMLEKVLPAIYEKWPHQNEAIIIQEDNAKPHHVHTRAAVREKALADNWNITVKPQPPNSPDFNILDLGFFASIQNLQYKQQTPRGLDGIITSVNKAFNDSPRDTMNDVFLSLQCALRDALSVDGDNTYKLSHIGKDKLRREGRLPISITCDPGLIARGLAALEEARNPPPTVAPNNNGSDTTESAVTTGTESAVTTGTESAVTTGTESAVTTPGTENVVFATASTENAVLATV